MDKELALIKLQSKDTLIGLILTLLLGGFGLFYLGILWGIFGSFMMALLFSVVFHEIAFHLITYIPIAVVSYIPASFFNYPELLYPKINFIIPAFYILFAVISLFSVNSYNKKLLRDAINKS